MRHSKIRGTQGAVSGSAVSLCRVSPRPAFIGFGCGCRSGAYPYGTGPVFHPARWCSCSPFQIFSRSCSRYHSATPCFTRRTRIIVALAPSIWGGSSVAARMIPLRDSSFSIFSALNVSRAERSMSSHATTANRGSGLAASASMSAMPPSRCSPAAVSTCQDPVWLRSSRSIPPDSTSANTAATYQP